MRKPITITVPTAVEISPEQVDRILRIRLHELAEGCYWEGGVLMEHYADHPHNGDAITRSYEGPNRTTIILALGLTRELWPQSGS